MPATPCVLAVVREPSEFAGIAATLSAAGIEARRAADLLDAVLHQADSPVGVVLCDADEVDWPTAVELFRVVRAPAAVVFLTRLADERLWVQMLEAGAHDLLEKPYRPQDLTWVVRAALNKQNNSAAVSAA